MTPTPHCCVCNGLVDRFLVHRHPTRDHYVFELECHGSKARYEMSWKLLKALDHSWLERVFTHRSRTQRAPPKQGP